MSIREGHSASGRVQGRRSWERIINTDASFRQWEWLGPNLWRMRVSSTLVDFLNARMMWIRRRISCVVLWNRLFWCLFGIEKCSFISSASNHDHRVAPNQPIHRMVDQACRIEGIMQICWNVSQDSIAQDSSSVCRLQKIWCGQRSAMLEASVHTNSWCE